VGVGDYLHVRLSAMLASGKRNLPFDPKLGGTVVQLFVLSLVRNVLELGYSNSLTRQDK